MRTDINPLLPVSYDIGWTLVGGAIVVGYLALVVAALWSIWSSRRLSGAGRLLWTVVVFAFPLLGSCAWFFWGRDARLDRGSV
jgi:hypothetical protein